MCSLRPPLRNTDTCEEGKEEEEKEDDDDDEQEKDDEDDDEDNNGEEDEEEEEKDERQLWSRREKYSFGYLNIRGNRDVKKERSSLKKKRN